MSLFHRNDREPQVNRIDEDMAMAAEASSRISDDASTAAAADEPLEESIDEPPAHAARYLTRMDGWSARSRRRLNDQIADTCESCDAFVQRKPWQSVGIAAFGGALLALLLKRH